MVHPYSCTTVLGYYHVVTLTAVRAYSCTAGTRVVPREPGYAQTWIRANLDTIKPGYEKIKIRIQYRRVTRGILVEPGTCNRITESLNSQDSHDLVGRRAEISFLAHLEKPLDYEPGSSGFEPSMSL